MQLIQTDFAHLQCAFNHVLVAPLLLNKLLFNGYRAICFFIEGCPCSIQIWGDVNGEREMKLLHHYDQLRKMFFSMMPPLNFSNSCWFDEIPMCV